MNWFFSFFKLFSPIIIVGVWYFLPQVVKHTPFPTEFVIGNWNLISPALSLRDGEGENDKKKAIDRIKHPFGGRRRISLLAVAWKNEILRFAQDDIRYTLRSWRRVVDLKR